MLQVVGVSFHVGSGCQNVGVYADAIAAARQVGARQLHSHWMNQFKKSCPVLQCAQSPTIQSMYCRRFLGEDYGAVAEVVVLPLVVVPLQAFDMGAAYGFDMELLDIGGGFTAPYDEPSARLFYTTAATINSALDHHFPLGCGVKIIAEPGRCVVDLLQALPSRLTDLTSWVNPW